MDFAEKNRFHTVFSLTKSKFHLIWFFNCKNISKVLNFYQKPQILQFYYPQYLNHTRKIEPVSIYYNLAFRSNLQLLSKPMVPSYIRFHMMTLSTSNFVLFIWMTFGIFWCKTWIRTLSLVDHWANLMPLKMLNGTRWNFYSFFMTLCYCVSSLFVFFF